VQLRTVSVEDMVEGLVAFQADVISENLSVIASLQKVHNALLPLSSPSLLPPRTPR
jgi:hypothetical protein